MYKQRSDSLKALGFPDYQTYLRSERWSRIRAKVLRRDGYLCQSCGLRATQVHHADYSLPVMRGDKNALYLLVSLCWKCHSRSEFEGGRKVDAVRATERMGVMPLSKADLRTVEESNTPHHQPPKKVGDADWRGIRWKMPGQDYREDTPGQRRTKRRLMP